MPATHPLAHPCFVDLTDFNTLVTNFAPGGAPLGSDWTNGDFNMDGNIDLTDFNSLVTNFAPGGYGSDAAGQVPEPNACLLLGIGLLGLCYRWCRRQCA